MRNTSPSLHATVERSAIEAVPCDGVLSASAAERRRFPLRAGGGCRRLAGRSDGLSAIASVCYSAMLTFGEDAIPSYSPVRLANGKIFCNATIASLVYSIPKRIINMRFVLVPKSGGRWVWLLRTANGEVVCQSELSFGTRESAIRAIQEVRANVRQAKVFNSLGAPTDLGSHE